MRITKAKDLNSLPLFFIFMIFFGYKTRITKAKVDDILNNACPNCKGDLQLSDLKKWFTLYFIPIFPFSHIETLYHCKACESSYKENIKSALMGSKKDQEKVKEQAEKMFATTLAACMTQMAKIDGKISSEEEKQIKDVSKNFKKYQSDINSVIAKVKKSKNNEEVYEMLRKARTILTAEGVMIMIAQIAKVLLADGKIDKKEEELMKEYMLICGIQKDLYKDIIERVKKGK